MRLVDYWLFSWPTRMSGRALLELTHHGLEALGSAWKWNQTVSENNKSEIYHTLIKGVSVILDLSSGKYLRKQNLATVGLNKMLRFPVCITAICALFLTKLQQRNCRCNCDVTGEESFTAKEMSSYKEICWKILVDRTEHAPICWRTLGSIILAICWLSLAICEGFTFLLMSPPKM